MLLQTDVCVQLYKFSVEPVSWHLLSKDVYLSFCQASLHALWYLEVGAFVHVLLSDAPTVVCSYCELDSRRITFQVSNAVYAAKFPSAAARLFFQHAYDSCLYQNTNSEQVKYRLHLCHMLV